MSFKSDEILVKTCSHCEIVYAVITAVHQAFTCLLTSFRMLLVLINSKCRLHLKLNGLELHLEWKKKLMSESDFIMISCWIVLLKTTRASSGKHDLDLSSAACHSCVISASTNVVDQLRASLHLGLKSFCSLMSKTYDSSVIHPTVNTFLAFGVLSE